MSNDDITAGFHLKRAVVLVGMMGSGKTAIGKSLAVRLNVPFLDSDAAIEEAAQLSISEIFERDGEPFFRKREAEVISRLIKAQVCVLSTGGGAFMSPAVRDTIAEHGVALWLDADIDLLWERVRHKDTRPLLRTPNPRQTLADIYETRLPIYALAGLRTQVQPNKTIDETTDQVLRTLGGAPHVLEPLP
ncbi:MAG: shikimate kinase [Pseudomonadota bacterium]